MPSPPHAQDLGGGGVNGGLRRGLEGTSQGLGKSGPLPTLPTHGGLRSPRGRGELTLTS